MAQALTSCAAGARCTSLPGGCPMQGTLRASRLRGASSLPCSRLAMLSALIPEVIERPHVPAALGYREASFRSPWQRQTYKVSRSQCQCLPPGLLLQGMEFQPCPEPQPGLHLSLHACVPHTLYTLMGQSQCPSSLTWEKLLGDILQYCKQKMWAPEEVRLLSSQ